MHRKKVKRFTVSVCDPSCMEMAKNIEIVVTKREDDHEQNYYRRRQA